MLRIFACCALVACTVASNGVRADESLPFKEVTLQSPHVAVHLFCPSIKAAEEHLKDPHGVPSLESVEGMRLRVLTAPADSARACISVGFRTTRVSVVKTSAEHVLIAFDGTYEAGSALEGNRSYSAPSAFAPISGVTRVYAWLLRKHLAPRTQ